MAFLFSKDYKSWDIVLLRLSNLITVLKPDGIVANVTLPTGTANLNQIVDVAGYGNDDGGFESGSYGTEQIFQVGVPKAVSMDSQIEE